MMKFNQNKQIFYSTTLTYEVLNNIAEVWLFDEHESGYQRSINQTHVNKIKKAINDNETISPTSIILGVDKEEFEKLKIEQIDEDYTQLSNLDQLYKVELDKKRIFRIIDGQHRIEAIRQVINSSESNNELNYHMFNVIIAEIKFDSKTNEIEMFESINSKGKRIKTDLAILAKYRYQVLYKSDLSKADLRLNVINRIAFEINGRDKFHDSINIWKNGIKVDVNNPSSLGIVGYKTFIEAITLIFNNSKYNEEINKLDAENNLSVLDKSLNNISKDFVDKILLPMWNEVYIKWKNAFSEKKVFYNDHFEKIYYNKDYYIQQTMGVKSLCYLFAQTLKDCYRNEELAIEKFAQILLYSKILTDDWKRGEKFKGLSSEAGFKIIAKIIQEQEDA